MTSVTKSSVYKKIIISENGVNPVTHIDYLLTLSLCQCTSLLCAQLISPCVTDTCWSPLHVTKINHTQMQQGNMPKEGVQLSYQQAYPFINITKYIQKIMSCLGRCLEAITLWSNVKNMSILNVVRSK